ncbi:MAG: hypothetical protein KIT14_08225 [bacterium]|nr:hypothetical protein [bacterium]
MADRRSGRATWLGIGIVLVVAATAGAQMGQAGTGCCCVTDGIAYRCSDLTQAECLKQEPQAPKFDTKADWKAAWGKFVEASKTQEARPMSGGWIAESCLDDINPKTGEPKGAPTGCCCYPPAEAGGAPTCKASVTEFDCKAECSLLKDGRLPSGCTWNAGACAH